MLTRVASIRLTLAALAMLVLAIAGAAYQSFSVHPCPSGAQECHSGADTQQEVVNPRSADDRVADYTLALTYLTAVLAVVALFQGYMLIRGDRANARAIGLAREEFNASKRPEIIVHAVSLVDKPGDGGDLDKHSFAASFLCFNKGTTPAKAVEVRGQILVTAIQDILTDVQRGTVEKIACVDSGGKFMFEMTEINERRRALPDGVGVYCVGTIQYLDGNNARRETGFCFELRHVSVLDEAWVPAGEPRLEYAY